MAISYIGATNATGNNTTSGNFTLPSGWAAGDVAIFWWYTYAYNKTFTKPSGVTQLRDVSASGYGRIFIGYRVLQAGDSTFAWTASSISNSDTIWGVGVFRNVDNDAPIDAESGAPATFLNTNDPNPPAITVVADGATVWTCFGKRNDYTSIVTPTNYVLCGSGSSTAGNDASAGTAYRLNLSAGSEDPPIFTLGGGLSGDDGYVYTLSLKPATETPVSPLDAFIIVASDEAIIAGTAYIDVPHGLNVAPDGNKIWVTAHTDLGGYSYFVPEAHINETTFRIEIGSILLENKTFGWLLFSEKGGTKDITKTSNGRILKTVTVTKASNGTIFKTTTITKLSDGKVLGAYEIVKTSDGRILKTKTLTETSDGRILKTVTVTKASNGRIIKTITLTATSDGMILGACEIVKTSDGRILKTKTLTETSDGTITISKETTKTSDGRILKTNITLTEMSDGRILKSKTLTETSDGRVLKSETLTETSDGRILQLRSSTKNSDSYIINRHQKTLLSNGFIRVISTSIKITVESSNPIQIELEEIGLVNMAVQQFKPINIECEIPT